MELGTGDKFVLEKIKQSNKPVILVLNKIDRLTDEKRSKSIFELENNEKVILEHHYGNDRIMVYSQSGFELGELDDKASKNILEKCDENDEITFIFDNDERLKGKVLNLDHHKTFDREEYTKYNFVNSEYWKHKNQVKK